MNKNSTAPVVSRAAGRHGLRNQGSTCFLNSVLQLLFMTPELHTALNRKEPPNPTDEALRRLFHRLRTDECGTAEVTAQMDIHDVWRQRCAAEHLELLLNRLSPEVSEMDTFGNEPIEMVALGRPFSLGMFYDCRSDKQVPGVTLWDKEKLERDKSEILQPNTEFKIVASESISDKASSLGVEASLKASFLSGLVDVKGSAKYLNNNKKSTKQARVTLQYKTTTVFKHLNMNQLGTGNLKHSEVIDKDLATHVVTGILYGAQAFFVFDQETSENEKIENIQGNLKVMISKMPIISIDGSGALKMEDSDKEKVNKFSCTFHGDFRLEKSPTTFEESVKVYQDLPKLLGPDGEKAVPVTVYLLPLSKLDSRASTLVRQISLRLVTEAENILEAFADIEMWCNDVGNSPTGQNFSQISKKIKTFKALCSEFKLGFQQTLAQKLPSIRGGGEEESALAEVLKEVTESPFNRDKLKLWIKNKDEEVSTIKTLMKLMKNTETIPSENVLTEKVCDSEKALVFVLTSLDRSEPFLSELDQYLKKPQSCNSPKSKPWYRSKDVMNSVRRKAKLFSDFVQANKDRKKESIQFLAVGLADEDHEGSTIYLYEDGFRDSENFELPSKPGAVTVGEVTESTVSLAFSAPSQGAQSISGYRVEFCEKGEEEWKQRDQAKAGEVTVNGLSPNTEYSVRVRGVTAVGVGPAATASFRTSPCGPPQELRGTASCTEISVRWGRPLQVGEGVRIHNYVVKYGQTQENIQWKTELSKPEEKVISGLQPETTYSLRVLCDCGEHGTSYESHTLTLTTTTSNDPKAGPLGTIMSVTSTKDQKGATDPRISVYQVLYRTPGMYETLKGFLQSSYQYSLLKRSERALKDVFDDLHQSGRSQLNDCEQHDAAEFMEQQLNGLNTEISQPFRGTLVCSEGHCLEKMSKFWTLPLPFSPTVEGGLQQMFQCNNACDINAPVKNRKESPPQILVFHLKRFDLTRKLMVHVKSDCEVELTETLRTQDLSYSLWGVVDHWGSVREGHYTATISKDGEWYKFKDYTEYPEQVEAPKGKKSSTAVLIIYRQNEEMNKSSRAEQGRQKTGFRTSDFQGPYHGLRNQGSTCYLNSVLQVLFMTPEIRKSLQKPSNQTDRELKSLFEELQRGPCGTNGIRREIQAPTVQRCAAEYLEILLNRMSKDVSEPFRGELLDITCCSKGHCINQETSKFWTLPLSMEHNCSSVAEWFTRYFEEKELKGMYCNECEKATEGISKYEMTKCPDILVLLLKTFNINAKTGYNYKSDCALEIPITLPCERPLYSLCGVVDHSGSLHGGHYTATIQSTEDGQWYCFNDTSVRKVGVPYNRTSHTAYLLIYRASAQADGEIHSRNMSSIKRKQSTTKKTLPLPTPYKETEPMDWQGQSEDLQRKHEDQMGDERVGQGLRQIDHGQGLRQIDHGQGLRQIDHGQGLRQIDHGQGLRQIDHGQGLRQIDHGQGLRQIDHGQGLRQIDHGQGLRQIDHGRGLRQTDHGRGLRQIDHGQGLRQIDHGQGLRQIDHGQGLRQIDHGQGLRQIDHGQGLRQIDHGQGLRQIDHGQGLRQMDNGQGRGPCDHFKRNGSGRSK